MQSRTFHFRWVVWSAVIVATLATPILATRSYAGPLPPPPLCGPGQNAVWIMDPKGGHWECRLIGGTANMVPPETAVLN